LLGNVLKEAVRVVNVPREAVLDSGVVYVPREAVLDSGVNVPREAVRVVAEVTGVGSVRPMPQPQPPKLLRVLRRKREDVLCLPGWRVLRVKSAVLKRRPTTMPLTTMPPLPRDPRLSWFVMSP